MIYNFSDWNKRSGTIPVKWQNSDSESLPWYRNPDRNKGFATSEENYNIYGERVGCYIPKFEEAGLSITGKHPERDLVETIELPEHPWFIGCQYHPELQSKPLKPHPLFTSFIEASYLSRQSCSDHQATSKKIADTSNA